MATSTKATIESADAPARDVRSRPVRRIAQGALAGALATLPMSAVMLLAQQLGLMGRQPPAKITDEALDAIDLDPPRAARSALAVIAHLGFGAAAGALFSLLRPHRVAAPRAAIEGAGFGTAVWGASYAGWVPALGIMPTPSHDRPGRQPSMVVAHWVFGAVLGALLARFRGPAED